MAGTAGKKARLYVATALAGPYTAVAGLDSISCEVDGQNLDVSEFGDDYMARIQGMKDVKISASGNYALTDTNGQLAIRSALLNDTALYAQWKPDGGTTAGVGVQCQVKVAKFNPSAQQTGKVAVSIELEGAGNFSTV